MSKTKFVVGFAMVAILLSVLPKPGFADEVGINFVDGWPTPHLEGKTADGFSDWTDSGPITDPGGDGDYPNSTAPLPLNNSNGLVTVEWASNNTWAGGPESNPDEQLYRVYLDDGGSGASVTFTGLNDWLAYVGAASYAIRFYHCTDTDDASFSSVSIRDGSSTTDPVIETVTATNMWDPGSGTRAYVDSSDTFTENIITITLAPRDGSTRGCVAGIKITSVGVAGPLAWDPDPADDPDLTGAEVPTNKTLSWKTGEDPNDGNYGVGPDPSVKGHHIYLGTDQAALEAIPAGLDTDPNFYRGYQLVGSETYTPGIYNETTNPGGLDTDGVYYWRIDERSEYGGGQEPNTWKGTVWTFQTTKLLPLIDAQPQDTAVFTNDPAEFSITITTATTAHYAWKKVNPDGEDPDVGTDADTLSFASAQVGDEGQYYCVVTNDAGSVTSATAWLDVKRLVGRWQLNNDLTDSAGGRTGVIEPGDGYGGTPPADPNFSEEGIEDLVGGDGQSYAFYDDVTEIIRIPDTDTDLFNFHKRSGLTVSAWVKTMLTDHWGAPVSRQDKTDGNEGWILNTNGSTGVMTIREAHNDIAGSTNITDNEWHLLTGTYDPATGQADIYIDGRQENGGVNTNALSDVSRFIVFGAETIAGDVAFKGLVDDVRIYNYPLSPFDVAYLYTSIMQDEVICAAPITLDLDATGTSYCVQDLKDFAEFAATWLECNLVPSCWNTPEHPID